MNNGNQVGINPGICRDHYYKKFINNKTKFSIVARKKLKYNGLDFHPFYRFTRRNKNGYPFINYANYVYDNDELEEKYNIFDIYSIEQNKFHYLSNLSYKRYNSETFDVLFNCNTQKFNSKKFSFLFGDNPDFPNLYIDSRSFLPRNKPSYEYFPKLYLIKLFVSIVTKKGGKNNWIRKLLH